MDVTPKAAKSHPPESGNSVESTPRENRELKHRQTLSSSLKERLKRSRRSFTSPFSVAKRLCVEDLETDGQHVSADPQETVNNLPVIMHSVDVNRHEGRSGSERLCGSIPEPTHPPRDVIQLRDRLRREVKDKTETVRRLKMVKMYRSKNDLTHLQNLIDKWRRCAQAALYELQSDVPVEGRKASLSEVIDLFGLDDGILHFNRTEEDFTI